MSGIMKMLGVVATAGMLSLALANTASAQRYDRGHRGRDHVRSYHAVPRFERHARHYRRHDARPIVRHHYVYRVPRAPRIIIYPRYYPHCW